MFYSASGDTHALCSKKTCHYIFDDNVNENCPFATIFGKLFTKSISRRQVFLFSHLTYFIYLLYLEKLSRAKYQ